MRTISVLQTDFGEGRAAPFLSPNEFVGGKRYIQPSSRTERLS